MCSLGQKTKKIFDWVLPTLPTPWTARELHFHVYRMKSSLRMRVKRSIGENGSILFCCSQVCSIQNMVRWDNELLCSSAACLSSIKSEDLSTFLRWSSQAIRFGLFSSGFAAWAGVVRPRMVQCRCAARSAAAGSASTGRSEFRRLELGTNGTLLLVYFYSGLCDGFITVQPGVWFAGPNICFNK